MKIIKKNSNLFESLLLEGDTEVEIANKGKGAVVTSEKETADGTLIDIETFGSVPMDDPTLLEGIRNELTDAMDESFKEAKGSVYKTVGSGMISLGKATNILCVGLPGASKSATAKNWCKQHGVGFVEIDAIHDDASLLIQGAGTMNREKRVFEKVPSELGKQLLGLGPFVLILDEYNRQKDSGIRAAFFQLISGREIPGADSLHKSRIPKLMFTVVMMNPTVKDPNQLQGTTNLYAPEINRLWNKIYFHSNKASAKIYFNSEFAEQLKNMAKMLRQRKNRYITDDGFILSRDGFKRNIQTVCASWWISLKILECKEFDFTSLDDYIKYINGDIPDSREIDAIVDSETIMTQRLLTDIVDQTVLSSSTDNKITFQAFFQKIKNKFAKSALFKPIKLKIEKTMDFIEKNAKDTHKDSFPELVRWAEDAAKIPDLYKLVYGDDSDIVDDEETTTADNTETEPNETEPNETEPEEEKPKETEPENEDEDEKVDFSIFNDFTNDDLNNQGDDTDKQLTGNRKIPTSI